MQLLWYLAFVVVALTEQIKMYLFFSFIYQTEKSKHLGRMN